MFERLQPHFLLSLLLLASCTLDGPADEDCFRGKCDLGTDVRGQLDGLDEPIADWLRASPMTGDGILETDLPSAMKHLADFSGCDIETLKTFVINDDLVGGTPFPRLVSTLCSNDDIKASSLFVAASFSDPANPDDVDRRNLEMFAWDNTLKENIFYVFRPVKGSDTKVQVDVRPKECESCHLNGNSLDAVGMPMVPIMNELVTPWPHWNSEPDFPSHTFELPERVRNSPTFAEMTAGSRLGAAGDLEQFIRSLQTNRVIPERLKRRRDRPAKVEDAMALLRPIFCDEQVNYVTEDHGSSVMPIEVAVAGGTREAFQAVQAAGWPWGWANDGRMRFQAGSTEPLTLIPVRGNLDIEYVRRLVAVGAISAEKVLRVLALDWTTPVFSEFRCSLWKDARARLRANPPQVASDARNLDIMPMLYDEIMHLDGEVSLVVGADAGVGTSIIALAEAEADAAGLKSALAEGKLGLASCSGQSGFCATNLTSFGALIDARVRGFETSGRDQLRIEAVSRFCFVRDEFANRPALPEESCEPRPRHSPNTGAESSSDTDEFVQPAVGASHEIRLLPDGGGDSIESALIVPPNSHTTFVGSLKVRAMIDHSWRGDLMIRLRAPDGTELPVVTFDPGDSANDVDAAFHIFGADSELNGAGSWTLIVTDRFGGERGHLLGWSIGINTEPPQIVPEGTRVAPR